MYTHPAKPKTKSVRNSDLNIFFIAISVIVTYMPKIHKLWISYVKKFSHYS